MNGIAHISFQGGAMFLPAHSLYERQLLVEHVTSWARSERLVQVLDGKRRWHFHFAGDDEERSRCSSCGRPAMVIGRDRNTQDGFHCAPCALGERFTLGKSRDGEPMAA